MEKISLALDLKPKEWERISKDEQEAYLKNKSEIEQEKARKAIEEAYKNSDRYHPRAGGFRNLFRLAGEYRWPLDQDLANMLKIAIRLRLTEKAVTDSFELNAIDAVLRKKEFASGLSKSPWKEEFLAGAKKEIPEPEQIGALIEAAKKSGIGNQEYTDALKEAVRATEEKEGFTLESFQAKEALGIPIDWDNHIARLLEEADKHLKNGNLVYRTIEKYQALLDANIEIGEARREIMSAYEAAEDGQKDQEVLFTAREAGIISEEESQKTDTETEKKPWWKFW